VEGLRPLNEGDIDTCLAHLSPDFVINLAGVPPMHGREVWRQVIDLIKRVPVLAAAIANDIGTPVDEEKLATALSHDVIASLRAALSNG
jgi:hypothetical protein